MTHNPYVGLRPFTRADSLYFFGRREQTADLLQQLRTTRFLGVVGSSGCGKSSLIRAGLVPALEGGFLVETRDQWRVAMAKPGDDPVGNLAAALCARESEERPSATDIENLRAQLKEHHTAAAVDYLTKQLGDDSNLLLLIDQFEEIFAFRGGEDDEQLAALDGERRKMLQQRRVEAGDFVNLLLALAEHPQLPVYVVLTMRTDFLGDCDLFYGLPEAMNRGRYLVPRLSRAQLQNAVEGPALLVGAQLAPRLIDHILNQLGDRTDRLPVLQHSLMRTFKGWDSAGVGGRIDLKHYREAGGLESALAADADEALERTNEQSTRKVFQFLTDTDENHRRVRHPALLSTLSEATGLQGTEIQAVLHEFERGNRHFVHQSMQAGSEDPRIDISHESLIRRWPTLRTWVDDERKSRDRFRALVRGARNLHRGEAGLLRDPELSLYKKWRENWHPTAEWARRYTVRDDDFAAAMDYLEASVNDDQRIRREQEADKIRKRKLTLGGLAVTAAVSVLLAFLWLDAQRKGVLARDTGLVATASELLKSNPTRAGQVLLELDRADETPYAKEKMIETQSFGFFDFVLEHGTQVNDVSFSDNGIWLATGSEDGKLRIWSADEGKIIDQETPHYKASPITAGALSPTGDLLAVGSEDGVIQLVELPEVLGLDELIGVEEPITSVRFNHDGSQIVSATRSAITVWAKRPDGKFANPRRFDSGRHAYAEFGPRSDTILGASRHLSPIPADARAWWREKTDIRDANNAPKIYELRTAGSAPDVHLWRERKKWGLRLWRGAKDDDKLFKGEILDAAFFFHTRHITAHTNTKLYALDATAGDGPEALEKEFTRVLALDHASERAIVLGNDGPQIWLLTSTDTETEQEIGHEATQSPTGALIAEPDAETEVAVSRKLAWALEATLPMADDDAVAGARFGSDGQSLLVVSEASVGELWQKGETEPQAATTWTSVWRHESIDLRHTYPGPGANSVVWQHKPDNAVYLWTADSEDVFSVSAANADLIATTYSDDGNTAVLPFDDGRVRVLAIGNPGECCTVTGPPHPAPIHTARFAPDHPGRLITLARDDPAPLLWQFDGKELARPKDLRGHDAAATVAAFGPHGGLVAVGATDGATRIWNLDQNEPPEHSSTLLHLHKMPITSLAFDATGGRLLTGSDDRTARLWFEQGGSQEYSRHGGGVTAVAFMSSGERSASRKRDAKRESVLTGARDAIVRDWPAHGNALPAELGKINDRHTKKIGAVLPLTGNSLLTTSRDGTARIWRNRNHRVTLGGHGPPIDAVAVDPAQRHAVTGYDDGSVRVWDLHAAVRAGTERVMEPKTELRGHTNKITAITFSRDGTKVATASLDGSVRVWRMDDAMIDSASARKVLWGAGAPDNSLLTISKSDSASLWFDDNGNFTRRKLGDEIAMAHYSRPTRQVLARGKDGSLRVWPSKPDGDAPDAWDLPGPMGQATRAELSADGTRAAIITDGALRIWDTDKPGAPHLINGQDDDPIAGVQFDPAGERVLWWTERGAVSMSPARAGTHPSISLGSEGQLARSASISPDGSLALVVHRDGFARIVDTHSGAEVRRIDSYHKLTTSASVRAVSYSPDGARVAVAWDDGTVMVCAIGSPANPPARVLLTGHASTVYTADFDATGDRLVTASRDKTARVWNARTGATLHVLLGHDKTVTSATFSADGTLVATSAGDGTARVWDAASGKQIVKLVHDAPNVWQARFSRDGQRVLTAAYDNTARLWDSRSGRQLYRFEHDRAVYQAEFDPQDKFVVTLSLDRTARVWDVSTGKEIARLSDHPGAVYRALFSPDGQRVLTASSDGARVWAIRGPDAGQIQLLPHEKRVADIRFSEDGRFLATASSSAVRVWDDQALASNEPIELNHESDVNRIRFSPTGNQITTAYKGGAQVWRLDETGAVKEQEIARLKHFKSARFTTNGAAVVVVEDAKLPPVIWPLPPGAEPMALGDPDDEAKQTLTHGNDVLILGADARVRVWHGPTGKMRGEIGDKVVTMGVGAGLLNTVHEDGKARIWTLADLEQEPETLQGHATTDPASAAAWHVLPNGKTIVATGTGDGQISIWSASEPQRPLAAWRGHPRSVTSLAFDAEGRQLVSTSVRGRRTLVWRLGDALAPEGDPVDIRPRGTYPIVAAIFDATGSRVLTADGHEATLFDARSGERLKSFADPGARIHDATFDATGKRIATSSGRDRTVRIWNAETAVVEHTIRAVVAPTQVAFDPGGDRIALPDRGGAIQISHIADPGRAKILRGRPGDRIQGVAFSADGRRLAATSRSGTVTVWDVQSETILSTAALNRSARRAYFDRAGGRLLVTQNSGPARILDVETGEMLQEIAGARRSAIAAATLSPDGRWLATAGAGDRQVWLWDRQNLDQPRVLGDAGTTPASRMQFDRSGTRLLTLSGESSLLPRARLRRPTRRPTTRATLGTRGTVRVWRTDDRAPMLQLAGQESRFHDARFTSDGREIVAVSGFEVRRFAIGHDGPKLRSALRLPKPSVRATLSAHGNIALLLDGDTPPAIWRTDGRDPAIELRGFDRGDDAELVLLGPKGSELVAIWKQGGATLWKTSRPSHPMHLVSGGPDDDADDVPDAGANNTAATKFTAGVIGPNSAWVVLVSADGNLRRFKTDGTEAPLNVENVEAKFRHVWFGDDGRHLLAAAAGGDLAVWAMDNQEPPELLSGTGASVLSAAVSPSGEQIATASDEGIKLWNISSEKLLAAIRNATFYCLDHELRQELLGEPQSAARAGAQDCTKAMAARIEKMRREPGSAQTGSATKPGSERRWPPHEAFVVANTQSDMMVEDIKATSDQCAEKVQGRLEWNYQRETRWAPDNVARLCTGTSKPEQPPACFERAMHGGIEHGGGTSWTWRQALDLCRATDNAAGTIRCFSDRIHAGASHTDAINACKRPAG